jgi:diguanylate cyclase (GGDEF)-like protein
MGAGRKSAARVRLLELACVAGAGLLITVLSLRGAWPSLTPLILFSVLLVWADNASVELPTSARVSPAFMVVMASIAAFHGHGGVLGAAVVGMCGGLSFNSIKRRKFRIILFNSTQYAWAGAGAAFLFEQLIDRGAPLAIPVVAAAVAFAAINVLLVLPGVALDSGTSARVVWKSDMAPAMPNYLIFGLLGTLIGELYKWLGPISVIVLVSPLVVARSVFLAFMRLRQTLRRMELLYGFTRRVGGQLDVDSVVDTTLTQVREVFGAKRAELLVVQDDGLVPRAMARTIAEDDEIRRIENPVGPRPVEAQVLAEMQPVVGEDGHTMVVPVYGDVGGVIGTLTLKGQTDSPVFSQDDLKTFETIANHASVAFANGRLVERLRYDSLHDALTGLGNRAFFQEAMDDVARDFPQDGLAAVMLLDLDRFKEVNDTLGHESGDKLLKQIALRLTGLLGDRGHICRLGGDEFAILLPELEHLGEAGEVAHQILGALEQPFSVGDMKLEVGGSIGVALAPVDGETSTTLLQRADVAMYAAKEARTGWELYAKEQDRYSPRRLSLASDLRHAVEDSQLALHYQPKAELGSGRVAGVEALVRWNHPEFGMIPPDEFIPLAEHTGLIRPLTSWVLDEAVRQARSWSDLGMPLSVAVNLSVRSLMDGALPDEVAATGPSASCAGWRTSAWACRSTTSAPAIHRWPTSSACRSTRSRSTARS